MTEEPEPSLNFEDVIDETFIKLGRLQIHPQALFLNTFKFTAMSLQTHSKESHEGYKN